MFDDYKPTQKQYDDAAKTLGVFKQEPIEDDNVVEIGSSKKKKTREATRDEHLALFPALLGKIRKDIFTDTLLCLKDGQRLWRPVSNQLDLVRSECRHLSIDSPVKYAPASIDDHFGYLSSCYPTQIVPEIPQWDGQDRIAEMAAMLTPNPEYGIENKHIEPVLKEWLANIFRKIDDPTMDDFIDTRSFIFLLQGGQKIGKDAWIRMLLCGWGQWMTNFSHGANERDTLMQIHRAAILNISEFDRFQRYESNFIKDLITRPDSNMRASHAREEETRESRCSFIASVNPIDILKDTDENTRYCIIPLEGINFNGQRKDVNFSLQCLAQAIQFKKDGFFASEADWLPIKALVNEQTPEDPNKQLAEWWEVKIKDVVANLDYSKRVEIEQHGYFYKHEVDELLTTASNVFKLSRNTTLSRLYNSGLRYRETIGGARCIKIARNTKCNMRNMGELSKKIEYDAPSWLNDTTMTDDTTDSEFDL